MTKQRLAVALATLFLAPFLLSLRGDEGMWLFNRLPLEELESRYGFRPPEGWAERIQRSAVRLASGGSGSIVSSRGLVLTNHHVVASWVAELSTKERNLTEEGFQARSHDEELRIPGAEILSLERIVDVTDRVQAAAAKASDDAAAGAARRATIAEIETEAKEATGLQCEVVTLYRGGEYHLYQYRRYDDVRLVFVPELAVAFYGGDADNFEFPRYCLDMAFVRIWEKGEPAKVEHWLPWSEEGLEAGDLTFVAGHPGRTRRLDTLDHLRFRRDLSYPEILRLLYRREIALQQFGLGGPEAERLARDDLFGIQNARKAYRGILQGLQTPATIESKARGEALLSAFVAEHPDAGAALSDWQELAAALEDYRRYFFEYQYLERGRAFWSSVFGHARSLVRLAEESAKPGTERLPEYREAALPRVRQRLTAAVPIHLELEVAKLTDSLTDFASRFGAGDPLVAAVLAGKSPAERAYELLAASRLLEAKEREKLAEGGAEALAGLEEPMIALVRSIDARARAVRKRYETSFDEVQRRVYGRLSKAAFARTGTGVYPDATFTLRLAFGPVKGWEEAGRKIEPFTRMAGAFALSDARGGVEPYELPERWRKARATIDGEVPFNFVSTADIIGGNSGSPVMNRRGELVGLIFDGNIHSLVLDIAYSADKARAVSVDARAILESLRKIYRMDDLVKEITAR